MKSQAFYSLKDLIIALGAEWDDTMQDVIPKFPLFYGSKDEVFTEDTHQRHKNHDTIDGWLSRYNKRYYSKKHDCWLTMAHCMSGTKDKLIGHLCTEQEKQAILAWKAANPDKVKASNARNNSKSEHKENTLEYNRDLRDTQWRIDRDITLSYKSKLRLFQANILYKWSTLMNYYRSSGATSAAMADGWYKVE